MTNIVQAELQKMVDQLVPVYQDSLRKRIMGTIDRYEPEIVGKTYSQAFGTYSELRRAPFAEILRSAFMAKSAEGRSFTTPADPLARESEEKITRLVEKEVAYMTSMLYDGFVAKNLAKMDILTEGKTIAQASGQMTPGALYGNMDINFTDGSRFTVTFDVVTKCSHKGTWFNQFPTRFTNVWLSDGTKMKTPSEAKMKREFK